MNVIAWHAKQSLFAIRRKWALCATVSLAAISAISQVQAQNIYWNGTGTSWNSAPDWWDSAAGSNNVSSYSGPTIVANFNAANVAAAQAITLDGNQVVQGLEFTGNDSGGESIASGSGTNTLTVGTGGILDNLGSGADSIATKLLLSSAQTWTNNSNNTLTLSGGGSLTNDVTTPVTLTLNGTGATTTSGALSNGGGTGASLSVLKGGAGLARFNTTATYTGATVIDAGTLQTNVANSLDGTLKGSPTITVNSGGTLLGGAQDSFGFNPGFEVITLNGGTINETSGTIRQTILNTVTMIGGTITAPAGNGQSGGSYSFIQGLSATSDAAGNPAIINATNILLEMDHSGTGLNDGHSVPITVTRGPGAVDLYVSSAMFGFGGSAPFGGGETMGFTKNGDGIMSIAGRNIYNGDTTINAGTLVAGETSGTPLGTGNIFLNGGTLGFSPVGSSTAVSVTGATGSFTPTIPSFSYGGGGTLLLNRGQASTLTFTVGSGSSIAIQRSGAGTLTIAAAGGIATLGVTQFFKVATGNSTPTVTNGIVNTSIVGQNNDASLSADFLTYTSNGFVKAAYSPSTNINAAGATAVYNANSSGNGTNNNTLSAPASLYALINAGQIIALNGQTLTLGNGSNTNPAGVILNGGQINGGTLAFRGSEATVYTSLAGGTVSSTLTGSGGLTKFGPGTLSLTGAESYAGGTTINLGALVFANGSSLTNTAPIKVGDGGDVATLIVNGGAVSISTLSLNGSTTASVNIQSGSLSLTNSFNYSNAGVIAQTGGTFSAGGFVMSNGSLLTPSTYYLGGGSATFNQTSAGSLVLGAPQNVNVASFYVSRNGALTVNGDGAANTFQGNGVRNNLTLGSNSNNKGGMNIVVQQGGTVTANMSNSANPGLSLLSGGKTSNYYLNGGTLTTTGVEASAQSNFFFGGGTFTPGANNESVPIAATINAGGAVFDTGGMDMTWSGSLVAGRTGNVSGYTALVGGSGYTTPPTIVITGGGGTGAAAAAVIQNGTVVDVIVTNPGNGYISPPSFTFSGGGGSGAVASSLVSAGAGGVTKLGSGTLFLSGASTYAGDTTVIAGSLEIDGAPSLGNNSNINVAGGTLRFNLTPSSSGTVAIGSGVTATISNSAVLELAGTVSALSTGGSRVHIVNNGSTPAGFLVTGTNQQVGGIDGAGATQINAGGDLTADHIVQSALVIGGTSSSHGVVTIAASYQTGNPLGLSQSSGLGIAGALTPSGPFSDAASAASGLLPVGTEAFSGDPIPAGQLSGNPNGGGGTSPVPEPGTLVLLALAWFVVLPRFVVRRK